MERPDGDVPPPNAPADADAGQPHDEAEADASAKLAEDAATDADDAADLEAVGAGNPPAEDAPVENAAEPADPAIMFVVRASLDGGTTSERIAGLESAHERFSELADEHPAVRISLYGPGGALLRRRPANPGSCRFCDDPAAGTWPVTAFGGDTLTRRRDVIALCPEHHSALTAGPEGYRNGPWLWRPGHSIS